VSRTGLGAPSGVEPRIAARGAASDAYFAVETPRIAALAQEMAGRFKAGGRLLAWASTAAGWSDARHIAVEFVHPVIMGKRALPALAVVPGPLVRGDDMRFEFGDGAMTVDDTWTFSPSVTDPFLRQELIETTYHLLWEHVHVFLEHADRPAGGAGASSFLYPFLTEAETDQDAVLADVGRSVAMKSDETRDLRAQTLGEGGPVLAAAAAALRERLDAGGTLLALGNGGSATDAADAVADMLDPPHGWPVRRAIDLAADPAILTALANDIGPAAIFLRQVIAYGGLGDAVLAFSTSGDSENVIAALAEGRRRGLLTIAFVGYGGGKIAGERLADHVVVTRSQHIPRIQEAQASAWHVLRELVEGA
jgi:D-sedoheptulose 7-phosphate isomerase